MAAVICITVSLGLIECVLLSGQSKKLYNPASLATVVAAALVLSQIAVGSGLIAAAGFTLTYLALAVGLLLFNASLYSPETLFVPLLTSFLLLGELLFLIFPANLLLSL